MSRRGDCYDNSVAGRFFWSLRHEWTSHYEYADLEVARQSVFQYGETYCYRYQMHESRGYRTPTPVCSPARADWRGLRDGAPPLSDSRGRSHPSSLHAPVPLHLNDKLLIQTAPITQELAIKKTFQIMPLHVDNWCVAIRLTQRPLVAKRDSIRRHGITPNASGQVRRLQ